jgi:hypothetical protein
VAIDPDHVDDMRANASGPECTRNPNSGPEVGDAEKTVFQSMLTARQRLEDRFRQAFAGMHDQGAQQCRGLTSATPADWRKQ